MFSKISVRFGRQSQRRLFETIKYEEDGKMGLITLAQPKKLNAMSGVTYQEIPKALEKAAKSDVTVVGIIGEGKFYTSGNDMSAMAKNMADSDMTPEELSRKTNAIFQAFVDTLIDFPKPICAMVNGPAIGIGVTQLPLCDLVWASDSAYFRTPFTQLGLTPEGCSSYLFPKIMGTSMANELLLMGAKKTAHEMQAAGLISSVYPASEFRETALARLKELSEMPPESVRLSKSVVLNESEREKLHAVNAAECEILGTRYASEEVANAVVNFMMRKKK